MSIPFDKITSAKYTKATRSETDKSKTDDFIVIATSTTPVRKISVPISTDNTDYNEIMKQVKAGTLTIKDAD
tara:strand:- start:31 stop:246 length:216 start_codon:yes stop_codon:yes gene_type:complete